MSDEGFGSELWKNVQAVQFGEDGGIDAPVRANGKVGVTVGLRAVARSDGQEGGQALATTRKPRHWWNRLLGR